MFRFSTSVRTQDNITSHFCLIARRIEHILGLPTDIFNVYPASIKYKTYQARWQIGDIYVSVSYTHLDVYKRQPNRPCAL